MQQWVKTLIRLKQKPRWHLLSSPCSFPHLSVFLSLFTSISCTYTDTHLISSKLLSDEKPSGETPRYHVTEGKLSTSRQLHMLSFFNCRGIQQSSFSTRKKRTQPKHSHYALACVHIDTEMRTTLEGAYTQHLKHYNFSVEERRNLYAGIYHSE